MREIVKSGVEFLRGMWGAILVAPALLIDPIDIAKWLGAVPPEVNWNISVEMRQAVVLTILFAWVSPPAVEIPSRAADDRRHAAFLRLSTSRAWFEVVGAKASNRVGRVAQRCRD